MREPTPSDHMDDARLHTQLSPIYQILCGMHYYRLKHVDENNAILSVYEALVKSLEAHSVPLVPSRLLCVCIICMWFLFKCTFPLMLNAPRHWFVRFVEWQTISVTNSHTHTYTYARSFGRLHKMHQKTCKHNVVETNVSLFNGALQVRQQITQTCIHVHHITYVMVVVVVTTAAAATEAESKSE